MIGMEDGRHSTNRIGVLINGQYISNSNTIANNFNNFFINVGKSLSSNIKSESDPLVSFQTKNNHIYIPELNKFETTISFINNSASGYMTNYLLQL